MSVATVQDKVESNGPGAGLLHEWWGLSYASYAVMPRTILQSLPDEMQGELADLLARIDKFVESKGASWPPSGCEIHVRLRRDGKYFKDELANYERGRRRLW